MQYRDLAVIVEWDQSKSYIGKIVTLTPHKNDLMVIGYDYRYWDFAKSCEMAKSLRLRVRILEAGEVLEVK
jgi:hypothetical protein